MLMWSFYHAVIGVVWARGCAVLGRFGPGFGGGGVHERNTVVRNFLTGIYCCGSMIDIHDGSRYLLY